VPGGGRSILKDCRRWLFRQAAKSACKLHTVVAFERRQDHLDGMVPHAPDRRLQQRNAKRPGSFDPGLAAENESRRA
jgi:hypothetical protein